MSPKQFIYGCLIIITASLIVIFLKKINQPATVAKADPEGIAKIQAIRIKSMQALLVMMTAMGLPILYIFLEMETNILSNHPLMIAIIISVVTMYVHFFSWKKYNLNRYEKTLSYFYLTVTILCLISIYYNPEMRLPLTATALIFCGTYLPHIWVYRIPKNKT